MAVNISYLLFAAAAAIVFFRVPVRPAILLVFLGGWLFLPVGRFPEGASATTFPWWITGTAVPSDMLVTKAWIAPCVALAGAAAFDAVTLRRWRPALIDIPMGLWCIWPLIAGLISASPDPSPGVATLYVTGSWGVPWLLGRGWFAGRDGRLVLIAGLALAGLICLPFAIIEGLSAPGLYGALYEPHPFRTDGSTRPIGFRPIGFFEHGNQYGIWVALCALAFIWLAVARPFRMDRRLLIAGAILTCLIAVASQSIGALFLLVTGLFVIAAWEYSIAKPAVILAGALTLAAGAVHVSGVLPLQHFVRDTNPGRTMLAAFRQAGGGSFAWRVSQDTKILGQVHQVPLKGTARWDWWRPFNTRPWGLALLLAGQYGLIGLGLAFGSLCFAAWSALARERSGSAWHPDAIALPLAVIVLLALADGLLNAFFFFPAVIAAGAIAASSHPRRSFQGEAAVGQPARSAD